MYAIRSYYEQLALWLGFSALSWIGGRRFRRAEALAPAPETPGRHLLGKRGAATGDFRRGHGAVEIA